LISPRTIPATEISGYTNTAAALKLAQQELGNSRTIDQHGQPVKKLIILISDGTADVLFDAPYAGKPNLHNAGPFYCGRSADDINNPQVQSSCPHGPAQYEPRAPIMAAVGVADEIRATTSATIYSVVTGQPDGYTAADFKFDQISPDHYYLANRPDEWAALVDSLEMHVWDGCEEYQGAMQPAAGARVTISYLTGAVVYQGVLNTSGAQMIQLSPGSYALSVAHLGVVAPQDPFAQPRNYTRLVTSDSSTPVNAITFLVDSSGTAQINARLVIDNPANGMCPQ
jgi:hypothetical protein